MAEFAHIAEGLRPLAVPIAKLLPDPANVRRHPDRNMESIKASLARYGQRKPVVANRATGMIEAGNATWEAARALGWTHLAVVYVEDDPTTAAGYAVADNRTAELAEWDDKALTETLKALRGSGELPNVGFDEDELRKLVRSLDGAQGDGFDPEAALAANPELASKVQRGQVWGLGKHRLMCGDATRREDVDLLMGRTRAAMLFTDPPYNVDYGASNHSNPKWSRRWTKGAVRGGAQLRSEWESFLRAWMREVLRVVRGACYICMSAKEWPSLRGAFAEAGGHWSSDIIWVKDRAVLGRKDYHSRYEAILYGWPEGSPRYWLTGRERNDVWEVARHAVNELHPTQKPVELVRTAVLDACPPDGIVLDPFVGSGTTMVACEGLAQTCYAMDIEPKWCAVSIARWEAETGQSAVLDA